MSNRVAVLYFTDGPETKACLLTADDMLTALADGATRLPLSHDVWPQTIESLEPGILCLLASHGDIGENGTLQGYLESRAIRHSHSTSTISALLSDKHATKLAYRALNINTPDWVANGQFHSSNNTTTLDQAIRKPRFGGSKVGIERISLQGALPSDDQYIYEQVIDGEAEVSVAVLYRDFQHQALTPIERKRGNILGELESADGSVDDSILKQCTEYALTLSAHLGTRGVVKTDFLIDPFGKVWAIETDAIPGLSRRNAVAVAANRAGISYEQLLNILIEGMTE